MIQGKPLTADEKTNFIKKLRQTNGNVSKACQAVKIGRTVIYEHRKTDADFARLWDETLDSVLDEAEQEVFRRAVKGVNKPVFYKGVKIAALKEYSDRLLEFMLKAGRPEKFRERFDIDANIKGSLDVSIIDAIDQIYDDAENDSQNSESDD